MRKNCSSDGEELLKFRAEGREFVQILRSLEQFIQTVKGQHNLLTFSGGFSDIRTIIIHIGKK